MKLKKCSDCHWQRIIDGPTMAAEGYTICTRTPRGGNGTGKCKGYARKRWLWFAWWIPKVLLITLALVLGGCSGWGAKRTEHPDGRVVITANQWQCLTDASRTQMKFTIPDLGIAEVGTSILDAESLAEIIKALPEGIRKEILMLLGVKP